MSDEGWVTPAEEVLDTSLEEVTPLTGKGALGKRRASYRKHHLDTGPETGANLKGRRVRVITMHTRGVYGRAFKPRDVWEGSLGKAAAANRTREIRPFGMRGGLEET